MPQPTLTGQEKEAKSESPMDILEEPQDSKPTDDDVDKSSDVEEVREHVPKAVVLLCGDMHGFVSRRPKCAMATLCLLYLFWLLLVIILMRTEGEDFIRMISEVPMYIRGDPIYSDSDAYKQAVDESNWDASATNFGVENQQSAGFPGLLENLVLIIEIDGLGGDDDEGLLAADYQEKILELEAGLMELAGFDKLQLVVYEDNTEVYRIRPYTITNLFDPDYAPWAFNHTYDSTATVRNTLDFYVTSKLMNRGESMAPIFSEDATNEVKTYYAGYGYSDSGGYEGYDTFYAFKFQLDGTNYSISNLMYTLADASFGSNPGETTVKAVMSIHYLGLPVSGYNSSTEDLDEQADALGISCYETAHDYLFRRKSANGLNLYWTCTKYYKPYYIGEVISADTMWLMATISFVYMYMVFNVNSFFIASMGVFMIFMAFTPGMVLYRYIAGYAYFGTLNMLVLFIMLSIGADNIFVLNDTWQQERNRAMVTYSWIRSEASAEEIQKSIHRRLQCTVGHTGKVMFTTSISTMMSFVSNSISSFPGIYCFGAFAAIVVAVNYIAVCTFMPTALVVHELYFWTDESWGCCQWKRRKTKVEEKKKSTDLVDERRPIDIFLEEKCFSTIYRFRLVILIGFFIMQSVFLIFMSRLEPDPSEPLILPATDPVQAFNTKFTQHFTRFVDPFKITNHIAIGIDGIDRSGTDETVPEDLGKAVFADVAFYSEQEQQFLEQLCTDAETGDRYGDLDGRMVNFEVDITLQCFMIQVRNSIYEDSYYETFMDEDLRKAYYDNWYDGMVNRGATYTRLTETAFIDASDINNGSDIMSYVSACYENNGPWTTRKFPIVDPYIGTEYQGACFMAVFILWLNSGMSASDPNYSPGQTNYDHYKEFIWAASRETDDPWSGEHYLNFFEFTVELSIGMTTDYEQAFDYYDNWEAWLNNWKNNVEGVQSQFSGYGCGVSDTCIISDYVAIPPGWSSSIMFTDTGIWTFYVMQSVILAECFSGIFLALLFAFCVMVFATGNWIISVYASIVILGLVIDVMGFTVMQGYKLSVVEAVIYIMVVGMSVDYVVHLAEAYLHSGELLRVHAARRMLGIVGISVISGAVSTCGGIMFLILSYNEFFYKFGLNIFFLMVMASLYSLVGFTAAMSSFGPEGPQGNTKICWYWCRSLCNKDYKAKVEELTAELAHPLHKADSLKNLPMSSHAKLIAKRQATLQNEQLDGGCDNANL